MAPRRYGVHCPDRTEGNGRGTYPRLHIKPFFLKYCSQSFELYLNDSVDTEEHAIALAKLLASHFSIRGAHLTVQARLSSQHVSHILTGLSNWLIQKLKASEGKRDKEMTKKVSTLFRALVQLVLGLEPNDALKLYVVLVTLSRCAS